MALVRANTIDPRDTTLKHWLHAPLAGMMASILWSASAHAGPVRSVPRAAPPTATVAQPKIAYRMFTLPNGLTTIIYTDRTVPNVFVGLWYRVGSKDEPAGRTGFAHLFEHMMFQPTANRQGDWFAPLTRAGATGINGMTTTDWTKYHETVPTGALDLALWMESDRMSNLAGGITQQALDGQRNVVKNEKRQSELQPGVLGTERYLRNYYPAGHPYAHTVIGSMEDLDKATLDDVKRWFADYYGAANAVLVLSGDIDFDTAKEKVTRYFGSARPGRPLDHFAQWLPDMNDIKRDVLYDAVSEGSITRSWPLANDDPRLVTLLMLAGRTMAGGEDTPLQRRLVDELGVATSISAEVSEHSVGSSFDIAMSLAPGADPAKAGEALDAALRDYFRTGPTPDSLQSVIRATDIGLLRSMESATAVGTSLIQNYIDHGDPLFVNRQRAWIGTATPADLIASTRDLLTKPYYEFQVLPLPVAPPATADVDRTRMPEPAETTGDIRFPPIAEARLSNGMRIVVAERRNLPVVDASLQFATGSVADARYTPGTARNAFQLLQAGSTKYDATQLRNAVSQMGATISSNAGGRQGSFSWSTLASQVDDSFALAADVVRHPRYPQANIDAINTRTAAAASQYGTNPIAAAGPVLSRALWGADHPAGKIYRPGEIPPLSRDTLMRFHATEMGPNNATLFVMGDITLARAQALAEKYFGDWKPGTPGRLPDLPPPRGTTGRVILIDAPGATQSTILAGHLVRPGDKDLGAAESLADAALGSGFGARLNQNLREDKGWAYHFAAGVTNAPVGPRLFTATGSVQADKTAASMAEIRREIAEYVTTRPETSEELERDRVALTRSLPAGYASNAGFLSSMITSSAYGQPYNRAEGAIQRLKAVTLDDVRRVAAQTYHPDQLTWVVVGDLSVIERDIRALNLGPVEVDDAFGNRLR